jgi:hypothetical protein
METILNSPDLLLEAGATCTPRLYKTRGRNWEKLSKKGLLHIVAYGVEPGIYNNW